MLKVGGKRRRKERKKDKKHTNSIARIRVPETSPRSQGKKHTRYVRSLNIMSRSITRPTILKGNTSHAFSNANKGKKNDVNSANIFKVLQKKIKAEKGA